MRARGLWFGLLGTLALAGLPAPAAAQPVGEEFQINTYTTFGQRTYPRGGHSVAADASGNFVVIWLSYGQDGSSAGIFGQRYDSAGGALGSEFRVNSYTTSQQSNHSVAAAADGDFVVVWRGAGRDDNGIFGQRYDSMGMAQGGEFRVNSYTTGLQRYPSVGSDASGNFVVVWQSDVQDGGGSGIFGQRYDSTGMAQGGEFRVNSYTTSFQQNPSVASDASGTFVVVWESGDGSYGGIFGQRYDSAGGALGSEFRVNSYTTNVQLGPSIASDASGNVVVTWTSYGQDVGNGRGIFGQRYDSAGIAQGEEFRVNSVTRSDQAFASVASDAAGDFVVAWTSYRQDESQLGVFGQRYDSSGVAQGDEFRINSFTTGNQLTPAVGATGINQFVVAWDSFGQDGSNFGVFGQRYDFSGTQVITVVSPNTNVRWRIGSLQQVQWTHNLSADETFRIELDRDDDGSYEELIAAAARADSATRGSFAWTVTGPPSGTARVRVSWGDELSVSDASDVTFQIRP